MSPIFKRTPRIWILTSIVVALLAFGAQVAAAGSSTGTASVSGGYATASGYYSRGVHDWGAVYSTGPCVHADVKLALAGYTDYKWKEGRACGNGAKSSWSNYHWGLILSSFDQSVVQGVYVRVCRERSWYPDDCSGWAYIGR